MTLIGKNVSHYKLIEKRNEGMQDWIYKGYDPKQYDPTALCYGID